MVSLQGKIEFTNGVFELNNRNLIELNLNFFSLNDISLPNYGIISNEGSLSFNDYDKTIEKNNKLGLLKTNVPIPCFLINSVEKIEETKGNWYSEKWQYDNNNNKVSVSLKDDLLEWQEILISKYALTEEMTMFQIYELLKSYTPSKFVFEIDTETEEFLKNIKCKYPYLESGSLWSQFDKLCQVCALHISKTPNNTVQVIHRV